MTKVVNWDLNLSWAFLQLQTEELEESMASYLIYTAGLESLHIKYVNAKWTWEVQFREKPLILRVLYVVRIEHGWQGCKVSVASTFLNSAQGFQNQVYADYFSFHSSLSFIFCDLYFRQSLTTKSYKKFTSTASIGQNLFFSQNGAKIAKSNIFSNSDNRVQIFE